MRISRRKRHRPAPKVVDTVHYRINEDITTPEVRLIGKDGENIGLLPLAHALAKGEELGLDVVEISPGAKPPVCRLLEYGKFKYEKEKELRKLKAGSKQTETKGIRLSVRIGKHDLEARQKQAQGFLEKGHKLKVELILSGRERQFVDRAKQSIVQFVESFPGLVMEQPIAVQGRTLSVVASYKDSKDKPTSSKSADEEEGEE